MEIRIVTMRYLDGLQGFPEDALLKICAGRDVLEVSEHFFVYGNVPHLTLVLKLGGGTTSSGMIWQERSNGAPDLEAELPEERKGVFRAIKRWRNEKAKEEGKPAYAIARNMLVFDIVKAMPKSLSELKEIDGVGESSVSKYGADILEFLKNAPASAIVEGEGGK